MGVPHLRHIDQILRSDLKRQLFAEFAGRGHSRRFGLSYSASRNGVFWPVGMSDGQHLPVMVDQNPDTNFLIFC